MMNICTETADLHYYVEAVDMGGDLITLLFNEKSENDSLSESRDSHQIEELLRMMQAAVMTHLKCSISCTLGPEANSLEECIEDYARSAGSIASSPVHGARVLDSHRKHYGISGKEYTFPAGKERQLVECLMTGKTEEAKLIYADIVSETATYPFNVFQLALSHLTMTLNHVRNTLKKNNQLTLDSVSGSLMLPVKDAEDIREVHEHFYRMFEELGSKVEEKRTLKHEELIRRINDIVERDYADPNLCLTSIAEELGMSQYTSAGYINNSP